MPNYLVGFGGPATKRGVNYANCGFSHHRSVPDWNAAPKSATATCTKSSKHIETLINIVTKIIYKYYTLTLIVILVTITVDNYMEYQQNLAQIERDKLPIDLIFGGWSVVFSFLLIMVYEWIIENGIYKLLIRILLTLIFLGKIFSNTIPIDDFDSGVENVSVVSGFIVCILLTRHGLNKLIKKYIKNRNASC